VPNGTSWTTTIDWVKFLVDNVEKYVSKSLWETLHSDLARRISAPFAYSGEIHVENLAATYTQNADTAAKQPADNDIENYGWVDFNPTGDMAYIFDSKGKASVKLRVNAGDTNELRVIPVELVSV